MGIRLCDTGANASAGSGHRDDKGLRQFHVPGVKSAFGAVLIALGEVVSVVRKPQYPGGRCLGHVWQLCSPSEVAQRAGARLFEPPGKKQERGQTEARQTGRQALH